ncbi:MAG: phosphotransferase [Limisphaerales bacterium]
MRLGIDFDNTLVCYDALFHRVAFEGGWIPPGLPANKSDVRNHLRKIGREDVWTEMQGRVYGPRLAEADPFPGALEFVAECRRAGITVFIISHKTRTPFAGEPHDLHQAALDWLERHGFFDPARIALPRSDVFLELTKAAKLERIAACGCTHFIDDLPEFLAEPSFPASTTRILFDPNRLYGPEIPFQRLHHWSEARRLLAPHGLPDQSGDLTSVVRGLVPGAPDSLTLDPLPGGANNQVFRVRASTGSDADDFVLKRYFQNADDPRDRFGAERRFHQWIQARGIRRAPEPVAWDVPQRLALFRFVDGRKLEPGEVSADVVDQVVAFVLEVNADRHLPEARNIPIASEACFSLAEHLDRIANRVARLGGFEPVTELDHQAARFVREELVPRWHALRGTFPPADSPEAAAPLPPADRCLSPSDFGFHNALLTPDGTLRFLDFEYAGWDDPAKLVCDFFCQPRIPVGVEFWDRVVKALGAGLGLGEAFGFRAARLLPAYRLKWCCILLNEFLPTARARRTFSDAALAGEDRKALQLAKAREAIRSLGVSSC